MTGPDLDLGVVTWPNWATQLWAVRCVATWHFPLIIVTDFDWKSLEYFVVTCWKMSIEVILKAAEYIERRERGKRHGCGVFYRSNTWRLLLMRRCVVLYSFVMYSICVFVEAEHGYAMVRPYFVENVSTRRRTASTPARRTQQLTSLGVRYYVAYILDSLLTRCHTDSERPNRVHSMLGYGLSDSKNDRERIPERSSHNILPM